MKPMIVLLAFGIISLGITFAIGKKHFDGVVEDKTFEASLRYDETVNNIKDMEKAFSNITITRDNLGNVTVNFLFEPEKTSFVNAHISSVTLVKPVGSTDIHSLTASENGYILSNSNDIVPGWYHLKLSCVDGKNNVTVTKSVYVE